MTRILLVALVLSCSSGPKAVRSSGFSPPNLPWCVDVKYRNNSTLETGRACFRYEKHCEKVRKGALKYGRLSGVSAVSACFR